MRSNELWFRSSSLISYPVGSLCFLLRPGTWYSSLFGPYCSEIVPKCFLKVGSNLEVPFSNPKSIPPVKRVEKPPKGFETKNARKNLSVNFLLAAFGCAIVHLTGKGERGGQNKPVAGSCCAFGANRTDPAQCRS